MIKIGDSVVFNEKALRMGFAGRDFKATVIDIKETRPDFKGKYADLLYVVEVDVFYLDTIRHCTELEIETWRWAQRMK